MGKQNRSVFVRQFEGLNVLDELLGLSGSPLTAQDVVERFRAAQAQEEPASSAIPLLFEEEPHFPDPLYARKLYQNLLGLWDALAAGERVEGPPPARVSEKKAPLLAPPHFGVEGPDSDWVAKAALYLEGLDRRGMDRLTHAFENRQDALLTYLDEQGLSDAAWASARSLIFELFCFLELGNPKGVGAISRREVEGAGNSPDSDRRYSVPEAFSAYADQALNEAGAPNDAAQVTPEEAVKVRGWVRKCLKALWAARRS